MMLFQPNNITPDLRGEFGNGVADVSQGLTITWQVNGNAPMTAFSISIFQNDSESTALYETGQLTDDCPFYGVDQNGDVVMFSYTIPAATLTEAGISNGNEYKFQITQWWSENDSVTQLSPSVFLTRDAPALTMSAISSPLASKDLSVTATFTQAQGDGLMWVRWRLQDSFGNVLKDTHNIYGAVQLAFSYQGLFTENTYSVRCNGETENGVFVDTGWQEFSVSYSEDQLAMEVVTTRDCTGDSAVKVMWPVFVQIPPTVDGPYSAAQDMIVLPSGTSVSWDTENSDPMDIEGPWSAVWHGMLNGPVHNVFSLTLGENAVRVAYSDGADAFILYYNEEVVTRLYGPQEFTAVTVVLTDGMFYAFFKTLNGALLPNDALYPQETLYPSSGPGGWVGKGAEIGDDIGANSVTGISVGGPQTTGFLKVLDDTVSYQQITEEFLQWDSGFKLRTRFLMRGTYGNLEGGSVFSDVQDLENLSVYRQMSGSSTMDLVASGLSLDARGLYDYGVGSQTGPYTYSIYANGQDPYVAGPAVSNEVQPTFWNWAVLSCSQNDNGDYIVNRSFVFSLEISSGTMSNNNMPSVLNNFTPYPLVQPAPYNYKSGTLRALIGSVDYTDNPNGNYSDSVSLRDAIFNLSTTSDFLFLKDRKGDMMLIRPSAEITMETNDTTREQAQTMNFPWVEVGEADGASVYQVES